MGTSEITQHWTKVMVTLQYVVTKISYDKRHIKPYTHVTNVEDIIYENYVWLCQHLDYQLYTHVYILNIGTRYIIWSTWVNWHIFIACVYVRVFHRNVIFFIWTAPLNDQLLIYIYLWWSYEVHIPIIMGRGRGVAHWKMEHTQINNLFTIGI